MEEKFKSANSVTSSNSMPQNNEILNSLRRLGLNQYETRAYHALSASASSTAGELSEKAELPRPRVYDVLTSLQEKGFVAIQPGRPVRYAALGIGEAVKTLRKQKEATLTEELAAIEKIGNELNAKMKNAKVDEKFGIEENVWTLKGQDSIYSKLGTMLANSKSHVMVSASAEGVARKFAAHGQEFEKARARGVKVKVVSKTPPNNLPKEFTHHARELPTRFVLADDQALLFLTEERTPAEDEVGLWVRSPHIVSTLKQLVESKK